MQIMPRRTNIPSRLGIRSCWFMMESRVRKVWAMWEAIQRGFRQELVLKDMRRWVSVVSAAVFGSASSLFNQFDSLPQRDSVSASTMLTKTTWIYIMDHRTSTTSLLPDCRMIWAWMAIGRMSSCWTLQQDARSPPLPPREQDE